MKARFITSACLAGMVAALFGASADAARKPPVPSPCPAPSPLMSAPKPSLVTPIAPGHFCIQPIADPTHP